MAETERDLGAGAELDGGRTIRREGERTPEEMEFAQVPDSMGRSVDVLPEHAGTLAGDTSAAGAVIYQRGDGPGEPIEDVEDDLGPAGTVVQEIGGEGRH